MRSENLSLDKLLLDPNNYRLQEHAGFIQYGEDSFHLDRVQNATRARLNSENLVPLRNSIVANGFLEIERIVVFPYDHKEDKFLVIEGNRRVAALMLIRDQYDAGIPIPENVLRVFDGVACLLADDEQQEAFFREAIMGIRHVGGIREWGGYQRAKLVADLRDNHDLDATSISERIGLSVLEVNRRYRAFKALQQMENDEQYVEQAAAQLYPVFHEAVSLPIVREWLGWSSETCTFDDDEKREVFYELITPRSQAEGEDKAPKIKGYSDVRALRDILPNREATASLLQLESELVDAMTIVKSEQISRRWRSEVRQATSALHSIPMVDVEDLDTSDVESIQALIEISKRVLASHLRANS